MENIDLAKQILELEEKIEKCNRAYYDENRSLISDYEYDLLKKKLEKLREEQKKQKGDSSLKTGTLNLFGIEEVPVEQKVGYRSSSKFAKITHKKRMASLANALDENEFYDFVEKTSIKPCLFPVSVLPDSASWACGPGSRCKSRPAKAPWPGRRVPPPAWAGIRRAQAPACR